MNDNATKGSPTNVWALISGTQFTIGSDDQLTELRGKYSTEPGDKVGQDKLQEDWHAQLAKIRVKVGTLLKIDTVSLLLGAGASVGCGGLLIGKIPLELELDLVEQAGLPGDESSIPAWLLCFYLGAAHAGMASIAVPTTREQIIDRCAELAAATAEALPVNYELLLSQLWRWRSALPATGGLLRLGDAPGIDLVGEHLEDCIKRTAGALANSCQLPTEDKVDGTGAFEDLLRKILTRPLNLKRGNIFTLNYDTLVEQAADAGGVVLIDGFVGTLRRIFRPECYDQDLYFPAQTTEGRVHRLDRVAHLYKLHGSITWRSTQSEWDNPYGVTCVQGRGGADDGLLIYPTPAKLGETLGMPYAELFRRFSSCVSRSQSTLIVVGYGFGDEHVNAIVRQALLTPSFTLVIVDPNPTSPFVQRLRAAGDRRVWVFSGQTFGTLAGFVQHVLPDLRDEDVRRRVVETYRALGPVAPTPEKSVRESEDAE